MSIVPLSAADIEARINELSDLLHACVMDGASVNFVMPYAMADAERFWRKKVLARMDDGLLTVLGWMEGGRVVGSVQLDADTPPNQAHRADVKKMLVHPAFQRRGIGRALMAAVEQAARDKGLTLLTLDTRSGDKGEPLYRASGFEVAGVIPAYSRDPFADVYDACTYMYKQLA
jgi:ribosomal protein S18 acetylase RimI-like enzyme